MPTETRKATPNSSRQNPDRSLRGGRTLLSTDRAGRSNRLSRRFISEILTRLRSSESSGETVWGSQRSIPPGIVPLLRFGPGERITRVRPWRTPTTPRIASNPENSSFANLPVEARQTAGIRRRTWSRAWLTDTPGDSRFSVPILSPIGDGRSGSDVSTFTGPLRDYGSRHV